MSRTVTLLPGDGIGPEVAAATVRILGAAGADFTWESHLAGAEALVRFGVPLPQEVLDSILRNGVALKGPVTTPVGKGFKSINVQLRQELELYANLRPVRTLEGIPSKFENIDLVVVRENTEDLYSGLEHVVVPGVVESLGWGVDVGEATAASGLPTIRPPTGWLREAQRFPVRVRFETEGYPKGVRYGSQASVIVYTGDNAIMDALGRLWIRLASWLSYVY